MSVTPAHEINARYVEFQRSRAALLKCTFKNYFQRNQFQTEFSQHTSSPFNADTSRILRTAVTDTLLNHASGLQTLGGSQGIQGDRDPSRGLPETASGEKLLRETASELLFHDNMQFGWKVLNEDFQGRAAGHGEGHQSLVLKDRE